MGQTERFDRDSTLFVARGLYILRYETGPDGYVAPTAFVAPASGFENMIEIIGPPGVPNGRLEGPGAVLFMRASDNASLRVGVKRKSAGGSLEAALKLESVGGLQPVVSLQADGTATLKEAPGEAGSNILFVAHVARRGDVSIRPCEWAAGPDSLGLRRESPPGSLIRPQNRLILSLYLTPPISESPFSPCYILKWRGSHDVPTQETCLGKTTRRQSLQCRSFQRTPAPAKARPAPVAA